MKRSTPYPMLVALVICATPLLISAAKVGQAAPDFTATTSNAKTVRLSDYAESTSCSSGTTMAAPTWGSITTAATCSGCKSSGPAGVSSGSRSSLRRRVNRGT